MAPLYLKKDPKLRSQHRARVTSWRRGSVWRPRVAAAMSLPVALAFRSTVGFVHSAAQDKTQAYGAADSGCKRATAHAGTGR